MKVGFHFEETWEQITERKQRELETAGVAFWGYGGSACHPVRQVQPFARTYGQVAVAMLYTPSELRAPQIWAGEMSIDGTTWRPLPPGVKTGGKWALVLSQLDVCEDELDLGDYVIAIGPSQGKAGTAYLRGQSDKACMRLHPTGVSDKRRVVMRGALIEPWAVFLRTGKSPP